MDKQLKDLANNNKMLKRRIKDAQAQIDDITSALPDLDNLPSSLERTEPKKNVLEDLTNNLLLSKQIHFGVCFEACNSFSALVGQMKSSLTGAGSSRDKKANRVSFGGNLHQASLVSNKRLSALSDLSFDSISNATFNNSSGDLNRTLVKSKGQPVVKSDAQPAVNSEFDRESPCLNKMITKSSGRVEESKRQIQNKTVTKSKKARDSTILSETIGSPLKKIARPSIQPLMVLSDSDDSPPASPTRPTTSHNLTRSKSDSTVMRAKKESKLKSVARTSKKSDMNATFTLHSTRISNQGGADKTNGDSLNVTALLDSHSARLNVTVLGSQNSLKPTRSDSCLPTRIARTAPPPTETSCNQTLAKSKSGSTLTRKGSKKESKLKPVAQTGKKSDMNATFTLDSTAISKQGADGCMTNDDPANVTVLGSQNSLKPTRSDSCLPTRIARTAPPPTETSCNRTLAKSKSGSTLTRKESKLKPVAQTGKKSDMNATFTLDSTATSNQDADWCMTNDDPANVTVLGSQNALKATALLNSCLTTPIARNAPLPTGMTPYNLRVRSERKNYKY